MIERIGPILSETEPRRVWLTSARRVAILGRTRPEVRMAGIHIETLRKLRDVLVEQRRNAANEAARLSVRIPKRHWKRSRLCSTSIHKSKGSIASSSTRKIWRTTPFKLGRCLGAIELGMNTPMRREPGAAFA